MERMRIFRVFYEYGFNIGFDGYDVDVGVVILEVWFFSVKEYGLCDDFCEVVVLLGYCFLFIDEWIFVRCIEEKGISVLVFLERKSFINKVDVVGYGIDVLVVVVRFNNFEVVFWLLKRGVDVNVEIGFRGYEFLVIGVCFLYCLFIKICWCFY